MAVIERHHSKNQCGREDQNIENLIMTNKITAMDFMHFLLQRWKLFAVQLPVIISVQMNQFVGSLALQCPKLSCYKMIILVQVKYWQNINFFLQWKIKAPKNMSVDEA